MVLIMLVLISFLFSSCSDPLSSNTGTRTKDNLGSSNSPSSVDAGYGRILRDNPIILSGNTGLDINSINWSSLLLNSQDFITSNSILAEKCGAPNSSLTSYGSQATNCIRGLKYKGASFLSPISGRWAFPPGSDDFWEVHTFAHVQKFMDRFQPLLYSHYLKANPMGPLGGGLFKNSLPPALYSAKAFWYQKTLNVFSKCTTNPESGAYYLPASHEMCFPDANDVIGLNPNQDPPVIYHETGHAHILTLMNSRNIIDGMVQRTELGILLGDEGAAIQEGLADFIAYGITQRTHFGEWALGRYYKASRPLTEADDLHALDISADENHRLSYPRYLNYDANSWAKDNPDINKTEEVHNGGQVFTHMMIAFVTDLQTKCAYTWEQAFSSVFFALSDTLAELGDLTSKQSNNQSSPSSLKDSVNLSELYDHNGKSQSLLWAMLVKPPNYRTVVQTFASKLLDLYTSNTLSCTSSIRTTYTQDDIEKLIDQYGLLLFKSFNNNRNGYNINCTLANDSSCQYGHLGSLTQVTASNRSRSVLISKDYLQFPADDHATKFFVFDKGENVLSHINALRSAINATSISNLIPSDLSYNNGNGKVSPGEVVGVGLNLLNTSNSVMAGVQVLANDWDQGKIDNAVLKPCNTFADAWPLDSEGAASLSGTPATPAKGDCEHITRTNGNTSGYPTDIVAPICWVQANDTNETTWISQETFRVKVGIPKTKCLDTSGNYTNDCFIRTLPGGDQSYYSRLDPQKTWGQTFFSNKTPTYNSYNYILFEVNPWTPPGTVVNCRFRARFTNCDDCWHDPLYSNDDPLDYEFSGGKFFKILNLTFTVE